jgi:hypothetical protein
VEVLFSSWADSINFPAVHPAIIHLSSSAFSPLPCNELQSANLMSELGSLEIALQIFNISAGLLCWNDCNALPVPEGIVFSFSNSCIPELNQLDKDDGRLALLGSTFGSLEGSSVSFVDVSSSGNSCNSGHSDSSGPESVVGVQGIQGLLVPGPVPFRQKLPC